MSIKDIFEKDGTVFDSFGFTEWDRYYRALNAETPVEKLSEKPWFLDLTDNEKLCYMEELKKLKEERKSFPAAAYEVRLKDFD